MPFSEIAGVAGSHHVCQCDQVMNFSFSMGEKVLEELSDHIPKDKMLTLKYLISIGIRQKFGVGAKG